MTQFRRYVLKDIAKPPDDSHAGLWLDKYLTDDAQTSNSDHVKQVTGIQPSKAYGRFFDRWKNALIEICGAENCREATTQGRLAVNLGAESVLETSIALHHTYGMPYIPGSALKGLAAHYVTTYFKEDPLWAKNSEAFITMFGDTTSAGYVTFYDALYVPGTGKGLVPDVITVHHPDYYQGTKPEYYKDAELPFAPPADWDSPRPIPFITANGSFLIALSGSKKWVKKAFEILELALAREGIGAKTSSGYGRMIFTDQGEGLESGIVSAQKSAPQEVPAGYIHGHVKEFGDTFGKIQPEGGGSELFVHKNELHPGVETLQPGQRVAYRKGIGRNNKEQALDVIPVE